MPLLRDPHAGPPSRPAEARRAARPAGLIAGTLVLGALVVLLSLANVQSGASSSASPTPSTASGAARAASTPGAGGTPSPAPPLACPRAGCPVQRASPSDPVLYQVYFGQVPPGGQNAPVLVFVHGLTGIARDWWGPTDLSGINDMYLLAYNAGFRTAFVTLQLQGQRGPDYTIERDAQLLQTMVPYIAQQYGVSQVDFVTHSKGGIDVQQAIYFNGLGSLTHNVFMLSAPNWGSPLAVQQCPPPMPNPPSAICEMTPEYMNSWEANVLTQPLPPNVHLWAAGGTDLGPPGSLLAVTGAFLAQHSGSNDGFVTVHSATQNPRATYLFVRPYNHDSVRIGHNAFPFILAAMSAGAGTTNASSAMLEPPLALAGGRSG